MKVLIISFLLTSIAHAFPSQSAQGYEIDSTKSIDEKQAILSSGKKDDTRFYRIVKTTYFDSSAKHVMKFALNFNLRCNNNLRDLRVLNSKDFNCPLSSDGMIESQIIRKVNSYQKFPHEIDRFIVQNRIKKRGEFFTHVDLVTVYEKKENNFKTYIVHVKMLEDTESIKYFDKAIKRNSVFKNAETIFTFSEQEDHRTKLVYDYKSETDHWLLNKSIVISRFFEGMLNSTERIIRAIEQQI